jgi:hypothetical protein
MEKQVSIDFWYFTAGWLESHDRRGFSANVAVSRQGRLPLQDAAAPVGATRSDGAKR